MAKLLVAERAAEYGSASDERQFATSTTAAKTTRPVSAAPLRMRASHTTRPTGYSSAKPLLPQRVVRFASKALPT
jgi:hypothetical protein